MTKIAIIGAGLSGLTLARLLQDRADITVFEKARGVGGRMSTRRALPYFFDHGAQYFTARTKAFQAFLHPLIKAQLVQPWYARYARFDGKQILERVNWSDEETRYVGTPSMNSMAKYLAEGLDLNLNTRVTSLIQQDRWHLYDADGADKGDFDWVVSTIPSPQASQLLPPEFKYHAKVSATKMQACFALMFGFSNDIQLEFDAAHVTNSDISWLAVNSHKPDRAHHPTVIVHSSAAYAQAHIDDNHEDVRQHLCAEASRIVGHDLSSAAHQTVHGWRYANNATRDPLPVLIDPYLRLAACGDWCLGGRIEGAFTSAHDLANALKEHLS